ncbi:hypothetical protein ULVI_05685 [Cochleicola gelatinilyticus]|uniref:Polysaccharide biosynthesis protein C-terminal domain-containing protein n=2 Tax=Cochleicola gelatinilyticus TaxID=1763537 RepID=A0A167J1A7_9FLAO|nr:hypothetical protein ULVI_05685 [Cochleicola gelatinilyticus]
MIKTNILSFLKSLSSNKSLILFDQALFSLFNFTSIFLLSKLADVDVFGTFVVFQSYIFFSFIFSTFFLSAPILVLLAKNWKERQSVYVSTLLSTNFIISFIIALLCYFFMKQQGIEVAFIYALLVPLLMSAFDIIKKYFFSSFKIDLKHAVIASTLLNVSFFIPVLILRESLSLSVILSLYAIAYAIATSYLIFILIYYRVLDLEFFNFSKERRIITSQIIHQHFNYSKWIILGGIAFWGYSQGLYIYAKALHVSDFGLSKVKTIQNILGIVNIFIISIENFYTPYFSNYIKNKPHQELRSLVKQLFQKNYLKILGLIIGVFIFAVVFYSLVYKIKYGAGFFIIVLFTITQLLLLAMRPYIISLKSVEVTYPFFIAHIIAVLTMLGAGYVLIDRFEYTGMAATFILCNIMYAIVIGYFYFRKVVVVGHHNTQTKN